jgi:hypothetical protein
MTPLEKLINSITKENHDTICDGIRKELNENIFATLEYYGKECVTDGSQLIELVSVDEGFVQEETPNLIKLPTAKKEFDKIAICDNTLKTRLENLAVVMGSFGSPLTSVLTWLRLILISERKDVTEESPDLQEAFVTCMSHLLSIDKTQLWLTNACCHWCSEATGVSHEEVVSQFLTWDIDAQKEFLENTASSMGFTVKKKG